MHDAALRQEIRELAQKSWTYYRIAKHFGLTRETVKYIIKHPDCAPREPGEDFKARHCAEWFCPYCCVHLNITGCPACFAANRPWQKPNVRPHRQESKLDYHEKHRKVIDAGG